MIGTEHLLLSILRDEDNIASQILSQFNVNYEVFKSQLENFKLNPSAEAPQNPAGGIGWHPEQDSSGRSAGQEPL